MVAVSTQSFVHGSLATTSNKIHFFNIFQASALEFHQYSSYSDVYNQFTLHYIAQRRIDNIQNVCLHWKINVIGR